MRKRRLLDYQSKSKCFKFSQLLVLNKSQPLMQHCASAVVMSYLVNKRWGIEARMAMVQQREDTRPALLMSDMGKT